MVQKPLLSVIRTYNDKNTWQISRGIHERSLPYLEVHFLKALLSLRGPLGFFFFFVKLHFALWGGVSEVFFVNLPCSQKFCKASNAL